MAGIAFDQLAALPTLRRFYRLVWRLFRVNVALGGPAGERGLRMGPAGTISPFCAALQRLPGGKEHCAECDRRHMAAAREQRRALSYRCHVGLTEFVIPIVLDGEIIALLQSGQVLDARPRKKGWLAARRSMTAHGVDASSLRDLYFKISVIPPRAQEDLISLLELFGNYIAHAQSQLLLLDEPGSSAVAGRARSYIAGHLSEPLPLEEVARAACTSRRNLTRAFLKETGATVLDFIHGSRVALACRLLGSAGKTCAQVAYESGFGSIQQFNRVFRKLKGVTPSAWRRRNVPGGY